MERYTARAITTGFDDGDEEGPFYRYFYAEDIRNAITKLRRNYRKMFTGGLINFLFGPSAPGILSISIKHVGKNQRWYVLFDKSQEHFDRAWKEYQWQLEQMHLESEEYKRQLEKNPSLKWEEFYLKKSKENIDNSQGF